MAKIPGTLNHINKFSPAFGCGNSPGNSRGLFSLTSPPSTISRRRLLLLLLLSSRNISPAFSQSAHQRHSTLDSTKPKQNCALCSTNGKPGPTGVAIIFTGGEFPQAFLEI